MPESVDKDYWQLWRDEKRAHAKTANLLDSKEEECESLLSNVISLAEQVVQQGLALRQAHDKIETWLFDRLKDHPL